MIDIILDCKSVCKQILAKSNQIILYEKITPGEKNYQMLRLSINVLRVEVLAKNEFMANISVSKANNISILIIFI